MSTIHSKAMLTGLRTETNILALQQFLVRMAHNRLTLPNPVEDV